MDSIIESFPSAVSIDQGPSFGECVRAQIELEGWRYFSSRYRSQANQRPAVKIYNKVPLRIYEALLNPRLKELEGMNQKLSENNCSEVYRNNLWLEQALNSVNQRRFDIKEARFTFNEGAGHYDLLVPGSLVDRPELGLNSRVFVQRPDNKFRTEGSIIERNNQGLIKCSFLHAKPDKFIGKTYRPNSYKVLFEHGEGLFQLNHMRIKDLERKPYLKQVLFPTCGSVRSEPVIEIQELKQEDCYYDLDDVQRNAIVNILRSVQRPAPYSLIGPGGVGKTRVVAEAVLQIYKRNKRARVLVCSYANLNVDELTKLVGDSGLVSSNEMVRILARRTNEEVSPEVVGLTKKMVEIADGEHLIYRLVFCTCGYAGAISSKFNNFDYVFIDTDRSTEVSVLATISLLKENDGVLVLTGNLLFEKPNCNDANAGDLRSLLTINETLQDRLHKFVSAYEPTCGVFDERFATFLPTSYRSERRIVSLLNDLFYKGLLKGTQQAPGDLLKKLNVNSSLVYCPVEASQAYDPVVRASYNLSEVRACFKLFKKLVESGLSKDQFGIVCPIGQSIRLKKYFARNNEEPCKMRSVYKFQGQERDVLIISPAASGEADSSWVQEADRGLLFRPKRFVTAMTRAKHMIILLGNRQHLSRDPSWARFIEVAEETSVERVCA